MSIGIGLEIACLMALGVLARKLKLVKGDFAGGLAKIVLNIALPCVIVRALMKPMTPEQLHGIPMTLLCVLVYLAVAILVTKVFVKKTDECASMLMASNLFCNFTFMGYPIMQAFYGVDGILLLSVISIPVRILLYSVLPLQFAGTGQKRFSFAGLKVLLIPAVIAIPVGLALGFFNVSFPEGLADVVDMVAATSTPLGMMICGMIIADVEPKALIKDRRALKAAAMRLVLIPALTLLCVYFLPLTKLARNVIVVFAALPTASIITAYAASYDVHPKQAAMIVTFSTLLSIVTLPVWHWILTLI